MRGWFPVGIGYKTSQESRYYAGQPIQWPNSSWADNGEMRITVLPVHRRRMIVNLKIAKVAIALTLLSAAAPLAAQAQQAATIRRIGYLSAASRLDPQVDGFRQGLREQGYVEGRNVLVEWRFTEGNEGLPQFAAELGRLKVEVIVAQSTAAALAAKAVTPAIATVFTFVADPVASGLVQSLARPGTHLTGLTSLAIDITGKRLELLKEAVPSVKSVAVLTDPANPVSDSVWKEARMAAGRLRLEVRLIEVRHSDELESAFRTISHERIHGVALAPGPFLFAHRTRIVDLAAARRVPVIGWRSPLATSGILISYGPDDSDIGRRAAGYVGKILRGARPADLPVEQPTKFELVINLRTARALGLTIPQPLLQRADQVIQ